MNCIMKIVCHVCIISWGVAEKMYFDEQAYIEIQSEDVKNNSGFGFSLGYSNKNRELVIGAPRYDLDGAVFQCSLKEISMLDKIAVRTKIEIDKLAINSSRELALDQNFFLGASISVASDFILTCAPLWRAVITTTTKSTKSKYGTYGACFIITDKVQRLKGPLEQLSDSRSNSKLGMHHAGKVYGGSGWSTLIDEANNLTLISLSPFNRNTDIGYYDTLPPLGSMNFMNVYKDFSHVFKDLGTFTSGRFFEDKKLTYAFSFRRKKKSGVVAFLQRPNKVGGKWEVMEYNNRQKPLYIDALDKEIGSMFGTALCAADLNSDGFSDLLVGAPAQADKDSLYFDSGAVHIFLGGEKKKINERRTILSTKSAGYFGRTIAGKDMDGDKLSEIFVSAPFEDNENGAVYIFNGQEIKEFVKENDPDTVKTVSGFRLTQRIQNKQYKWFGFSLQPLPDLDGNSNSELAIGAPKSGRVLLYRSVSFLIVSVSAKIDRDYVRVSDQSCNIYLKIFVRYVVRSAMSENNTLVVTMNVMGNCISIHGGSSFDLIINSSDHSDYVFEKNVTVKFSDPEPSTYNFNAEVTLKESGNTAFDKPRVAISPYSNTTVSVPINRRCSEADCDPNLTATINFSGGVDRYVLGTSPSEMVTVTVLNTGHVTYDSCVTIFIEGSEILNINGTQDPSGWYQIQLPVLRNGASNTIEIKVDMSKQTNLDKRLLIKVGLHNICNRGTSSSVEKEIPFEFRLSANNLFIDGFSGNRNITDTEIADTKAALITDDHIYNVINNGNVTWKSITARIKIKKQKFIKGYHISHLESLSCEKKDDNDTFVFTCTFDLKKYLKIVVTLDIAKDMFKGSLENGRLITTSDFELDLNKDGYKKINQITTTFYYQVDLGLKQNKALIIAMAVLLSAVILLALTYILYKNGFFKRPDKSKLEVLKHEERKRSLVEGDTKNAELETDKEHEECEIQETSEAQEMLVYESSNK